MEMIFMLFIYFFCAINISHTQIVPQIICKFLSLSITKYRTSFALKPFHFLKWFIIITRKLKLKNNNRASVYLLMSIKAGKNKE